MFLLESRFTFLLESSPSNIFRTFFIYFMIYMYVSWILWFITISISITDVSWYFSGQYYCCRRYRSQTRKKFNLGEFLSPHHGFDRLSTEESENEIDPLDDSDQEEYSITRKAWSRTSFSLHIILVNYLPWTHISLFSYMYIIQSIYIIYFVIDFNSGYIYNYYDMCMHICLLI